MIFKRDLSVLALTSQRQQSEPSPACLQDPCSHCFSWAWVWRCLHSLKKSTAFLQQAALPGRMWWVCAGGLATASSSPTHYIPGLIWPSRSYSSDSLTYASLPHSLLKDG